MNNNKANIDNVFGLTPMQEGMVLHYAQSPDTTAYVEQFDFILAGEISYENLEKSLNAIVYKYGALRTNFSYRKTDKPRQVIYKERTIQLNHQDISEQGNIIGQLNEIKLQDRKAGFDLSRDLLLRVNLVKTGRLEHHMVFTFHHVIMDGWCLGMIFSDLFQCYEKYCKGENVPLEREAVSYDRYIQWLDKYDQQKATDYWKEYLFDYANEVGPPYFDLPFKGEYQHANQIFYFDEQLTEKINQLCQSNGITFNHFLVSAWGVLLQKYQNTNDVVFGSVVSGRPPALNGVNDMVGLFINTIPTRVKSDANQTFAQLCQQVSEQTVASNPYEYSPLFEVQANTKLKNKLLDHVIVFENYPISQQMRALGETVGGLRVVDVEVYEQTNYDFNLIVNPGEQTKLTFIYNENRYSKAIIESLQSSLQTLVSQLIEQFDATTEQLTLCSTSDHKKITEQFNDVFREYPKESSMVQLFDKVVQQYPEKVALVYYQQQITFTELQIRATQLANQLDSLGIKAGDKVGLLLPRSPELIIAMLASLYCNACYVPIDIKSPQQRVETLIQEAELKHLCTLNDCHFNIANEIQQIKVDSKADIAGQNNVLNNSGNAQINPDSAAYILYTSGSTGTPKGCAVSHKNVLRLVINNDFYDYAAERVHLLTSAPVFDVSTFEIWGALLHGAQLCVIDENDILDGEKLNIIIENNKVTTAWLSSALFNQHVENNLELFAHLQYLLVGGDILSPHHINKIKEHYPHVRLINGYGPTENTVFTCTYPIERTHQFRIPIGYPVKNSTIYIVDKNLNMLPPGAYGELVSGADGVALGYVNQPELTQKVFIDDPFTPNQHQSEKGRLYRTGDIARWLPDGSLDLLGRVDFQVKVRGYRIELGEIERCANRLESIKEAVVVAQDHKSGKQLALYYSVKQPTTDDELLKHLRAALPGYMVPSLILQLPQLPINVSGKVDRKALPPITVSINQNRAKPRNETEEKIAAIFCDVLGLDEIDIFDNFFDIGANSLNLMTINNRIKKQFAKEIPLTTLFEHTTIVAVADFLSQSEKQAELDKKQAEDEKQAMKSNANKIRGMMRSGKKHEFS
ncbi:non-ribosomal peptide synthetase [Aliikangiella maris]